MASAHGGDPGRAVPDDVRHVRGHVQVRQARAETPPGGMSPSWAAATARCRWTYEYRTTTLLESVKTLLDTERAPVYIVNFTQKTANERAQDLCSTLALTKRRSERWRTSWARSSLTARRERTQAVHLAGVGVHHAGFVAQVPPFSGEARGEGLAESHLRHGHARCGRERPDPVRAVHAAVQVRREQDAPLDDARVPANRGPRRQTGFDDEGSCGARRRRAWWRI